VPDAERVHCAAVAVPPLLLMTSLINSSLGRDPLTNLHVVIWPDWMVIPLMVLPFLVPVDDPSCSVQDAEVSCQFPGTASVTDSVAVPIFKPSGDVWPLP